jgi:uncharacterized protein (DUF924 family)
VSTENTAGPVPTHDGPASLHDAWVAEVHAFWFEELKPEQWFRADDAVDAAIGRRFAALHRSLAAESAGAASPKEAVARVIVLDQFPRNMFRGSPAAYATDPLALECAQAAIAAGFDTALGTRERQFLYMPFQHSEDRRIQQRSVQLFESIGDPGLLDYATEHKAVIDRFGRFPHRNGVLGRPSTDEEIEFLATAGGPSWTQI